MGVDVKPVEVGVAVAKVPEGVSVMLGVAVGGVPVMVGVRVIVSVGWGVFVLVGVMVGPGGTAGPANFKRAMVT